MTRKREDVVLSTTHYKNSFSISPILNGDELYQNIEYLKDYKHAFNKRMSLYKNNSKARWSNTSYSKAINSYLLSPNPNPEDFVDRLKTGNLPEMYRKFLDDVGIALKDPSTREINISDTDYEM